MKSLQAIILLLFPVFLLQAQSLFDNIKPHPYKFSQQIREELRTGNTRMHRAAQDFSYIGNYQEALAIPNSPEFDWGFDSLPDTEAARYRTYTSVNAVGYLLERSKEEQIIIFSEAHHKPVHRILPRILLKGLYENGYRYLGLETLMVDSDKTKLKLDTMLESRGYPTSHFVTGTYTVDPQMGNLIREALEIGFTIFGYERNREGDREQLEAENIKLKVLDKDPNAKILILCGFYHAMEAPANGRTWMAQYLQEYTGINPLTIYQDILTERSGRPESPYYRFVRADEPSVLVNPNGDVYAGPGDFKQFDILLYSPRTTYTYGRPSWLFWDKKNRYYPLDPAAVDLPYPYMIKAFKPGEEDYATPIDMIEVEHQWDVKALVLPPGTYRLLYQSLEGQQLEKVVTVVE